MEAGAVGKEGRYHHGNLRQALLEAGLRLVDERGVDGLTLREVARRAGVSHAAPYHHFADKAALVDALVDLSFARLERALRDNTTLCDNLDGAASNLRTMGVAYVLFAWEHPAEFALMNRCREGPVSSPSGLGAVPPTGYGAFRALVDALVACQDAGLVPQGDVQPLALSAWSMVHGLAVLITEGPLQQLAASREAVESMARTVTTTLWDGLLRRWDAD